MVGVPIARFGVVVVEGFPHRGDFNDISRSRTTSRIGYLRRASETGPTLQPAKPRLWRSKERQVEGRQALYDEVDMLRLLRKIITLPYRRFARRREARERVKQNAEFDRNAPQNVRITHRSGNGEWVLIRDFDQPRYAAVIILKTCAPT